VNVTKQEIKELATDYRPYLWYQSVILTLVLLVLIVGSIR